MKSHMEILRGLREDSDMKQFEIAKLIGTTQQQYSRYETGESELPIRALSILAGHYGVSADYLLGRTECRQGVDGLNQRVMGKRQTVGKLISDVLSLNLNNRKAVLEYIKLLKIKENNAKN